MKVYKIDFARNVGMLCGSMANPMALSYVNSTIDGDEPAVAYATAVSYTHLDVYKRQVSTVSIFGEGRNYRSTEGDVG